jgi:hypothetical protein
MDFEIRKIRDLCQGKELTSVYEKHGELFLEFGDIVVNVTGGYSKDVYIELKRKIVTYESI